MSASICWEPVAKAENFIDCWAPRDFITTMEEAFGGFPLTLRSDHDLEKLRGMAVMCKYKPNPYRQLVGILQEYHEIRVWAVY